MLSALVHFTTGVAALITAGSVAYCLLSVWLGLRFAQASSQAPISSFDLPPVSILKPIKGADPDMYEALRSHCQQDYPEYEILFGITDANDAAVPMIEKLTQKLPNRSIRIVNCEQRLGANGKVSSLAQMVSLATHEILLVNDSDIRVEHDYLKTIAGDLQRPDVGLVTCLYRGTPARTIWSKLEALGISTDFVPGVLAARAIEGGMHFGLGSTLAFRKSDLVAIGGYEFLVDYLADDYELGRRIAELGKTVVLSGQVVETHLAGYDFAGFLSHQLRWARTICASRLLGYIGLLFTFTLPWAAAVLLLARGAAWTWWGFLIAVLARFAMALVNAKIVSRDRTFVRLLWLLPLRDFLAPFIWLAGLAGQQIVWRGELFTLKNGKLHRTGAPK
jgi:ceramide glucosyltransferase